MIIKIIIWGLIIFVMVPIGYMGIIALIGVWRDIFDNLFKKD